MNECICYCFFSGTFRGPTVPEQFSLIKYLQACAYFSFALFSLEQSEFCSDKPKSGAKYGLPDSLAILSEMGEVTEGMMDAKVNWNTSFIQVLPGNPGIYNLYVLKKLKGKVRISLWQAGHSNFPSDALNSRMVLVGSDPKNHPVPWAGNLESPLEWVGWSWVGVGKSSPGVSFR